MFASQVKSSQVSLIRSALSSFLIVSTVVTPPFSLASPPTPIINKPKANAYDEVEIIGNRDCDGIYSAKCGWGGFGNGDGGISGQPPTNGGGGETGGGGGGPIILAGSKGDARCSAQSGLKSTTSRSDYDTRALTAISIYRNLTLFEKKTAADAGYLAVTYADGGTEKWFITEPAFSDGGIVQAPNTLVKGDGVAKPKTCTV